MVRVGEAERALMSSRHPDVRGAGLPRCQDQARRASEMGNPHFGNSWSEGLGPGVKRRRGEGM